MRMAYFDGAAGAGGDMILAALVDAGARKTAVMRVLRKLSLGGCRVDFRGVKRGGFRALRATVRPPRGAAGAALARLRKGGTVRGVPHGILESGRAVLQKLFRAEGIVHGTRVKHVHLHELEDWDTVVDVFGTLAALEDLGVGRVYAGELVAGGGTVRTRHGELPAPAPGAAELLRGMKVTFAPGAGETVTPTAAAILGTLAERGAPPPMTLEAVGYGAGSRETPGRPNVTRVFIGSGTGKGERDDVVQLDAVVDDEHGERASG